MTSFLKGRLKFGGARTHDGRSFDAVRLIHSEVIEQTGNFYRI